MKVRLGSLMLVGCMIILSSLTVYSADAVGIPNPFPLSSVTVITALPIPQIALRISG